MANYRNPTETLALSNVQREWINMAILALQIRREDGSPWAREQEKRFTGVFRRFLTDSREELLAEIPERLQRRYRL